MLESAQLESASLGSDRGVIEQAAQLARAYMLNEDVDQAVRTADRALIMAERRDLLPIVADLLITKGASLSSLGRLREGVGLLEAGHRLAEGAGLVGTSLRAMVNLSGVLPAIDPRAALSLGRTGFESARRLGQRGTALIILSNSAEVALMAGDPDWAIKEIDGALSLELDPSDRIQMLAIRVQFLAFRGDPYDQRLSELKELSAGGPDVQTRAATLSTSAWVDFVGGRYEAAHASAIEIAGISAINAPPSYILAARAALTMQDPECARIALKGLEATGVRGPALTMQREAMEAGLAALEGRAVEAVNGFRDTGRRLKEVGMVLEVALNGLLSVQLLGSTNPDARGLGEEAREIFLRSGARPFIEQLDAALATPSDERESVSSPASRRVETAAPS
ncbi:MAG: hypothetical protein H0X59_08505 [Chloroflexi bacterium]|nr:hypothetical protein [Chloroflexota bacterium]